ncbi:MAG: aspartyl/glutamyl-tRNA amidotransferase subunit C [Spirochaetaceae bacterium]|jgi:aspartyl-tRNA(Asn)/glutamyl-tRNA(Gln) amidotransferase subunit C|nr:aspartyl/glutamyl-tRNA amidotransferase subunit C [Spirochaetaceae bacterium]
MQLLFMDRKELEETAALAHLNINGEELTAALPAFEQMLGFFALMQGADAEVPVPAAGIASGQAAGSALVNSGHFRGDAAPAGQIPVSRDDLLKNAGDRDGAFIVIPNVL